MGGRRGGRATIACNALLREDDVGHDHRQGLAARAQRPPRRIPAFLLGLSERSSPASFFLQHPSLCPAFAVSPTGLDLWQTGPGDHQEKRRWRGTISGTWKSTVRPVQDEEPHNVNNAQATGSTLGHSVHCGRIQQSGTPNGTALRDSKSDPIPGRSTPMAWASGKQHTTYRTAKSPSNLAGIGSVSEFRQCLAGR